MAHVSVRIFCLLVLTALRFDTAFCEDEFLEVTISQGTLRGKHINSTKGISYYSFQGIPYAKPPVGNLRFRAPVAAEPWEATYDALQEGNICTQSSGSTTVGDEDCLFVNVYIPQIPLNDSLLPVMVWIHGGAFIGGSGNNVPYGPQFILSQGIVYVSLNYRLGVIGFLSTADEAAPGNVGLKDQVLALRWIQQNIAAFGGDPSKVTIFGESAGATSVALQVVSPMSAGLFRGAIAQSGSATDQLGITENPRETAFFLGNALGFSGNSTQELVEFLRTISAEDLITTGSSDIPEEDQYRLMKIDFVPAVEPIIEGEETFISDNPINLLAEGKFNNVPFITGTTSAEGILFIGDILDGARTMEAVNTDFSKTFKPELRYCKHEACGDEMIEKIKSFYFGDQPVSNATRENLINMVTDMFFAEGVMYGVEKMSSQSTAPVYLYFFDYDGGLGFGKMQVPGAAGLPGACHADDLGYIFDIGIERPEGSQDTIVRSEMVTMWTNFVKTLNPTPAVTEDIPIWAPYTSSATNYLDITSVLTVSKDFHKERMDFWKDLFSAYSPK